MCSSWKADNRLLFVCISSSFPPSVKRDGSNVQTEKNLIDSVLTSFVSIHSPFHLSVLPTASVAREVV